MLRTKFSQKVEEQLQAEEKMAKLGVNSIETYNRFLQICTALYGEKKPAKIVEAIDKGEIDNHLIYQIIKSRRELIDAEVLDKSIIDKLEEVQATIEKSFKNA